MQTARTSLQKEVRAFAISPHRLEWAPVYTTLGSEAMMHPKLNDTKRRRDGLRRSRRRRSQQRFELGEHLFNR